jgi:eukaryotic-like serine/threonine-protein kinase
MPSPTPPSPTPPSPTPADLLASIRQYQLLEAEQLAQVSSILPGFSDGKTLARELLRRGWLSVYQANQLLQGRGQNLVFGSYQLLERLGEGGMGAVFKARHSKLGRLVALKVIRKERLSKETAVRRFQREIRAAAQLNHPNIVHAFDADEVEGTHLLVMEYVEGGIDLAQLVELRGPLPIADACAYIRQAALGLQHAYERGMVHRDIKPQNLLLVHGRTAATPARAAGAAEQGPHTTAEGQIKILDMGLARLGSSDEEEASALTHEGTMMGTVDYLAPEQAVDFHTVDIRADLYSLGCTLYYLLAGRVPFPRGETVLKLLKHKVEEPPPIEQLRPDVPPAVAAIVRKLLAKRPADRFQTPAELAQALATCPTQAPAAAAPEWPNNAMPTLASDANVFADLHRHVGAPVPRQKEPGRSLPPWRWLLAGAGAMVLVVIVLIIALLLGRGGGAATKKKKDLPRSHIPGAFKSPAK